MKSAKLLLIPAMALFLLYLSECKKKLADKSKKTTSANFINWNLVFSEHLTHQQRDSLANAIIKDINKVSSAGPITTPDSFANYFNRYFYDALRKESRGRRFRLKNAGATYCQCRDSLLWNLHADIEIDESGSSLPQTPKPKSTGPQGGIDYLSYNDTSGVPASQGTIFDGTRKLGFPKGFSVAESAVVAVVDTGMDSTLLTEDTRSCLMPFGKNGSQNVIIGERPDDYHDSTAVRHGTSVTSILLNEYYRLDANKKLPRIMILKAMDDSGRGDIFGMACAILHAINGHARLINISAGYFGEPDSVLNHFLHLSKRARIPVVAAAGNVRGPLVKDVCDENINGRGQLGGKLFFYPACVSPDTVNYSVISVTGVRWLTAPCYYQNFSKEYVTVGVVNQVADTNCCVFKLPFFRNDIGLEGSSFATPVVGGRLAHALTNGVMQPAYSNYIDALSIHTPFVVGTFRAAKVTIIH